MSTLAPVLQTFFTDRLISQRRASLHTIAAYRDTFRLLLTFAATRTGKQPNTVSFPSNRGGFFNDGWVCWSQARVGCATVSSVSSSTVIISSQQGQIPPAPRRWQGREQSGHHCSDR
jgi:hypothetical protein